MEDPFQHDPNYLLTHRKLFVAFETNHLIYQQQALLEGKAT